MPSFHKLFHGNYLDETSYSDVILSTSAHHICKTLNLDLFPIFLLGLLTPLFMSHYLMIHYITIHYLTIHYRMIHYLIIYDISYDLISYDPPYYRPQVCRHYTHRIRDSCTRWTTVLPLTPLITCSPALQAIRNGCW